MDDAFNMSMRKFLKQLGVTSQQAIEEAVRAAGADAAGKALPIRALVTIPALGLEHVVEGSITGPEKAEIVSSPDEGAIMAALAEIRDPASGQDIVSAGMVRVVRLAGADLSFVLDAGTGNAAALKAAAEKRLASVPGLGRVSIAVASPPPPAAKAGAARGPGGAPPELGRARKAPGPAERLPGIGHVIAVASGKGGVGKSTLTANLAAALAGEGRRVGLLDADVYGPSQPRMMGVLGRPSSPDGKRINPLEGHGVKLMSMGLLTDEAVIWRGPMLISALTQMIQNVEWGALDVLVVDLPPGTGDVQMTLCQKVEVDGALIISTPQDIALIDARKAVDMFRKMNVPVLGLIENMSVHVCSECGHREHIFGAHGVRDEAERLGVPLLAEIPLEMAIRSAGDDGIPITVAAPESPSAEAFRELARGLVSAGKA